MGSEAEEIKHPNVEQTLKKGRHRKKQLFNSILQQMEFYFSDSNLTKDRFLSQLIFENPHVDLNVFLKFNKIRKLTLNIEDIKKAIKNSKLIELSEDKSTVCRKEPIKEKLNVDDCTIYVERLKSDATHEFLSTVFTEFGNVVYISIPKYKHNNVIKGFAFIEFDKEAEAETAVNYFESIGCKMPSNTEPDQLCSIATFNNDELKKIVENPKKRKFETEESENVENKKTKAETGEAFEPEDIEIKRKKKLKKEHKKKNYIKELGLQVLSKKEWKKMRNRYLDLQKKKMKEFKKHLYQAKFSNANYEDKQKKGEESMEATQKVEEKEKPPKVEFKEGLIVKLNLTEPISDVKKLKNDVKALCSDIMYVDIPNVGSEDVFLRFSSCDTAKNFCTQESNGKKEVLTGDEEKSYWNKIQKDRNEKFNKTKKKQRGRDKLLKKAKRIKFDD